MENQKLELVADFYEYTMSNGYLLKNMENTIAYFDVFFRKVPDDGGYALVAGLEQIINYIKNLKFTVDNNFIIVYYKYKERFSYVRLFVCQTFIF